MIYRLKKITNGLYRGSAPSPDDVAWLKEKLGINKIISLDDQSGKMINRVCKLLHIKHINVPLDETRKSLINFLHHNLKSLLLDDGPTFIHCSQGRDRTGFVSALFECKYMGKTPEQALKEAKALGFGKDIYPNFEHMIELYEKIIKKCKPSSDINNADIVSNEREYIGDPRDSFLDESRQSSFAPFLPETREYPFDNVYNDINGQSPTRENYQSTWKDKKKELKNNEETDEETDEVPLVGIYNNDAGIHGVGPVENMTGFFYD